MGKFLGILLMIIGLVLLFFWAIPFLDNVSLFGMGGNAIFGFILFFVGIAVFFSRPRIR